MEGSNDHQTLDVIANVKMTFSESNPKVEKTPIMILQEICMKLAVPTVYDNISTEGQVHDPIFVYQVTCGNISKTGKGNSKKKAKQAAALSMLTFMRDEMVGKNDPFVQKINEFFKSMNEDNDLTKTTKSLETNLVISGSNVEQAEVELNPIGDLLEITQKCSLRPPIFEYTEDDGPAHNKQFTCHIKFGDVTETGVGRTKKLAKRSAAAKLLVSLKSNASILKDNQTGDSKLDGKLQFLSTKDKNKKVGIDFGRLKQSTGLTISRLLSNNNFLEEELNKAMLENLASEEKLEYNFFCVSKNKAGFHQVLLQIMLTPATVVNGLGSSLEEAVDNACYNALSLIKLLCSR